MNLDPRFFHSSAPASLAQDLAELPTHPIPLDEPTRPGPSALRPASTEALRSQLQGQPLAPDVSPHLGQALLHAGLIDRATLQRALALQARPGPHRTLGRILVEIGALSELRIAFESTPSHMREWKAAGSASDGPTPTKG